MLKTLFTIAQRPRYGWAVLLFLAATIAVAAPPGAPPRTVGASVQARATIRIISGAELRFGKVRSADPFIVRDTLIQSATGQAERVRVFEFQ